MGVHVRFGSLADISWSPLFPEAEGLSRSECLLSANVVHCVHLEDSEASAGYLAAIGKAVRQAIGVRVDDLPLRLENIERALWARPDVTA